ncbi:MAG: type II toxin-antitoxin system RelE/ParE family toxin [Firmicutes bacterium]|nr:type II toxin-antitoxin system RelE/ParE family toxin [Bacillota bacterium]
MRRSWLGTEEKSQCRQRLPCRAPEGDGTAIGDKAWDFDLTAKAKKWLDKLRDKELLLRVTTEIEKIAQDPYRGEDKKQDLKGVWGWSFTKDGTHYRIAYLINDKERYFCVFYLGTREGFWDEVKDYWRAYKKTVEK